MKKTKSTFLALIAILLSPMAANAGLIVIDFEDYAQSPGAIPTTQGDVSIFDFIFDSSTNHTHFANNYSGGDSGSTFFGSDNFAGISTLTMSLLDGGAFSLHSLDLGGWFEPSSSLQLTGSLVGGGDISTIIALGDFQTYTLDWHSLTSVTFRSLAGTGDQYYGMDNLHVRVPEPGTLALLGIGLLGMAAARRRKKA